MYKPGAIKEKARQILKNQLSLSTYYFIRDCFDKKDKYSYDKNLFTAIKQKLSTRKDQPIENDLEFIEFLHHLFPNSGDGFFKSVDGESDVENLMIAARTTFNEIAALGVTLENAKILDIGCGYGENLLASNEYGIKFALGIDYSSESRKGFENLKNNFEPSNIQNVKFLSCDFSEAELEDESFDLVISIASFEHFEDPEAVLNLCYRVLKKGGFLFAHFDPLFLSPFGAHRLGTTGIPYIQNLFSDQTVFKFFEDKRADNLIHPTKGTPLNNQDPYPEMNRWTVRQFDHLFNQPDRWEKSFYRKRYLHAYYFMSLLFKNELAKYTEEDLFTAGITALLRKI